MFDILIIKICKFFKIPVKELCHEKKLILFLIRVHFLSNKSNYSLEIKMTTENNRMKKIDKNINLESLLANGYYDNLYGFCNAIMIFLILFYLYY